MMATVPHITSGLRLRKFQADGFLLTRVYNTYMISTALFARIRVLMTLFYVKIRQMLRFIHIFQPARDHPQGVLTQLRARSIKYRSTCKYQFKGQRDVC